MDSFAWKPTEKYLERSRVREFMNLHGIDSWQELVSRSAREIEWFWNSALEHLGVEWFRKYNRLYDDSRGMPWTTWFLGGKLNIVHNCIDRHVRNGRGAATALRFEADDGWRRTVSYQELHEEVDRLGRALQHLGIGLGQRLAMCMPISPQVVTVMFAAFKNGAACMQMPARIPPEEVASRLRQAQAPILFLNDGYPRAGKVFSSEGTYKAVLESVPYTRWSARAG